MNKLVKRCILLVLFSCLLYSLLTLVQAANPSYEIVAVNGLTPVIDGKIVYVVQIDGMDEWREWDDANSATFNFTDSSITGVNCTAYVKQDGVNLYVAFDIPDGSYSETDNCSVLFDVDYDGNTTLQTDDVMFSISRNDILMESNVTIVMGTPIWTPTTISGWTGKARSEPNAWVAEFSIAYSKLNVTAGTAKTLGVCFASADTDIGVEYTWPPFTADPINPATWGDMTSINWIPEFPTWTSILLILVVLTVAIAIYKRRLLKTPIH